jgi:hypothetical protein
MGEPDNNAGIGHASVGGAPGLGETIGRPEPWAISLGTGLIQLIEAAALDILIDSHGVLSRAFTRFGNGRPMVIAKHGDRFAPCSR